MRFWNLFDFIPNESIFAAITCLSVSRREPSAFKITLPIPMWTTAIFAGLLLACTSARAAVVINEVAPKGDGITCEYSGKFEDWIELYNDGDSPVDIGDYVLHDDKGKDHSDAWTIPTGTMIASKGFSLFCKHSTNFTFGIGGKDTITLLNPTSDVLDTTGVMPDLKWKGPPFMVYAREKDGAGGTTGSGFKALRKPSPGASNKDMLPSKLMVYINEVADKGTDMAASVACNPPADYIELYNAEPDEVDIAGWRLHDDNGNDHADSYLHPAGGSTIPAGGYLLLCGEQKNVEPVQCHDFCFGIGSDDTITLLDESNTTMDSVGPLLKRGDSETVYGRTEDGGGIWTYLTPPTPGRTNQGMKYKPEGDNSATAPPGSSTVVLNEVADKGSAEVCDGEDWVELYNYGAEPIDIGGWHLADEKGVLHSDVYIFVDNDAHIMKAYSFMLLCKVSHFEFGIGGTDTVTLLNSKKQVVDSIELTGEGSATLTMQRDFDGTGDWRYASPSPGKSNCVGGCPLPSSGDDDNDDMSVGVIAGAVLGTFFGIIILVFFVRKVMIVKTPASKPDRRFIDISAV